MVKSTKVGELMVGDLIRFKENTDAYACEAPTNIKYRATKGQIGILIYGLTGTRFRACLDTGEWTDVSVSDVEVGNIEIISR